MIAWIKNLLKKDIAPEYRKEDPVISEPVLTLAEIWRMDKKRFKFEHGGTDTERQLSYSGELLQDLLVTDINNNEKFKFCIGLDRVAISKYMCEHANRPFLTHKLYPILGYKIYSQPTWMTYDESKYLCDLVTPYFKERVERYSKLVDYREDRKVEAGKRQTERAKQEERQRLVNLYTKES